MKKTLFPAFLTVLLCWLLAPAQAQQRSIVNPGFEDSINFGSTIITSSSNLDGWESSNGQVEIWKSGAFSVPASAGSQFVELNPSSPIFLYQNICITNGETIGWSFDHRSRNSGPNPQIAVFEIEDSSENVLQTLATQSTNINTNVWNTNSGSVTYSGSTGAHRIGFRSVNSGGSGNFLDNVQIDLAAYAEFEGSGTASADEDDASPSLPRVVVSGTVHATTTIPVNVTGGSAGAGSDYTQTAAFITIPAGVYDGVSAGSFFAVPVSITNDNLPEADKTIEFTLGAPSTTEISLADLACASTAQTTATHTIIDNDVVDLETTKTASVDDPDGNGMDAGDTITYTITIENTGNVTLNTVFIFSDTLSRIGGGGLTLTTGPDFVSNSGASPEGTLVGGEIATFAATYTLTQADIDAGGVSNTATGRGTVDGLTLTDVSDNGDDSDGNSDDDPTVTVTPATPGFELTKTAVLSDGGDGADAGDSVDYTLVIANTGNVTLSAVGIATDTLSRIGGGGLTLTTGPAFVANSGASAEGELAPGETATFSASYTLAQADIDAGGVSNTATATGTAPSGGVFTDVSDNGDDSDGNSDDDPTVTVTPATPGFELTKTAVLNDGGDGADAGDSVDYTLVIANTGNVTLSAVGIATDTLSRIGGGGLTLTSGPAFVANSGASAEGELAPGETATFSASYTLTQADIDAGGVSNTATATGTAPSGGVFTDVSDNGDDSDGNSDDDPTVTVTPAMPGFELTKTAVLSDGGDGADAGDSVDYTLVIANTGNVTLSAVGIATDTLSRIGGGGLTLTSGPAFVANSGASAEGELAPGETATFSASYTLAQADIDAGGVSNTATATGTAPSGGVFTDISDNGDDSDGNSDDDPTITVTPAMPGFELTKTAVLNDGGDGADAGDSVDYTLVIANTGNVTLSAVGIATDTLSRIGGGGLTLTSGPDFVANSGASAEGELAPGETATFSASYTLAQADIDAGGVSNTATATGTAPSGGVFTDVSDNGDDSDGNSDDDPTVTVTPATPGFELTKTAVLSDGGDGADAGDSVDYTLVIANTGNVTLSAVGIATDTLSRIGGGGLTLTSGPAFVANSGASAEGELAPGETATFSASYTLAQADIDAGGVSNTATATGTAPSGAVFTDISDNGDDSDGNSDDDPTVTVTPATPGFELTKTAVLNDGGDGADAGDSVDYTLVIANTGNVTLSAVGIATDTLSRIGGGGLTLTSGPAFVANSGASAEGELAPGETATFSASYTLTQADIDAGGVSNTATATGTAPSGGVFTDVSDNGDDSDGNSDDDPTVTVTPAMPGFELTKTAVLNDGGDGADAGDSVDYTLVIANTGNVTLSAVGIATDTLSRIGGGGLTLTSGPAFVANSGASAEGELAPGETATFSASYTLAQADIDAGGVSNTATATGTAPSGGVFTDISDNGDDSDGNSDDDPTVTVTPAMPGFELTKTAVLNDGGDGADAGDSVDYTLVIANTGNVTLSAVGIATDTLSRIGGGGLTLTSGPAFVANSGASAEGELAPGETATFSASYTLAQADIDAGGVSNTATATGTAPSGGVFTDVSDNGDDSDGNSDDDPTVTVTPATPGFELTKTAVLNDGGDGADAGDSVDYTLVIANTGNVTLSAVGIATDTLSRIGGGGLTLTSGPDFVANSGASAEGELAPGETATFSASYTLAQADIDAGGVSNTATATGTAPSGGVFTDVSDNGDDSDGNSDDDPTVTVTPAMPGFELTKTAVLNDGGDGADAGDSVDYTLVIANTGNVTLSAVGIATDTLSRIGGGGLTLTSGPAFVANSGASAEGELAPGETATFSASYTLAQADIDAGGVSNTATATGTAPSGGVFTDVSDNGDDSDGNSDDDPTVTVTPATPGFELTKTAVLSDGGDGADAGDSVDYTLVIANTGNVTLSAVGIATDTLSRIGGGGLTLTSGPAFVANSGASAEGELAPGETATFSASYTLAQADIDAGGVSNTATATGTAPSGGVFTDVSDNGDDSDGNSDDDPTVTVTPAMPGFELTKTAVLNDGGDGADAGDSVDYTLVIANTGNVTLSAVGIATDTLSRIGGGGLTLTSGPAFVANSGASAEGELAPGETATFSASYTLTQADIDAGGVSNTATATGTAPSGGVFTDVSDNGDDSDGNSDDDPTVTVTPATPGFELTKTAVLSDGGDGADAGDSVDYTLVIANTGNVTLSAVGIATDTLSRIGGGGLTLTTGPAFVANSGASAEGELAPGETATFSASYTLAQADIDAGGVSNTATATGTAPSGGVFTDVSDNGDDSDGNSDDDPTVTVTPATPGFELTKTAVLSDGGDGADAGDSVDYTLVIANTGNVTLSAVGIATDTLSRIGGGGLTLTSGPAFVANSGASAEGELAPGETATFSASYTLAQADIDAGGVSNTATATGTAPSGGVFTDISDNGDDSDGNSDDDPTVTVTPAMPGFELTKTAVLNDGGDGADAGDSVDYTLVIANTGNVTLSAVGIATDTLSRIGGGGLTLTSGPDFVANSGASAEGELAPGETATFSASYTLAQADIDAGGVSNTATATGTAPSGGVFTDVSDNGDDSDGNSDDDPTVTVTPATPGFELTKTAVLSDGGDGADAGDSVDYTLVIANTGNVTLSAVGIATDTLSRIGGGGLTLTSGPAFVANSGASAEGELAPGETATFSASYTLAQADIDAGGVSNTATATGTAPSGGVFTDVSDNGDDSDGNSDDDPTVTVTPATPGFELTKTALLNDGGDGADAGDSVDYTLVIANTGNVTLSAVGIATDTLSRIGGGGLTLTSGPAFVANSGASAEGELAPGETATFSASYTLAQADIDAGGVSNTATATGTAPSGGVFTDVSDNGDDSDGNSDDDPTVTVTPATPGFELTKTAVLSDGGDGADAGDSVDYTLVIANTGNVTLSAVGIATDTLSRIGGGGLTLTSGPDFVANSGASAEGELAPGETATFSASYTLAQADIDAGGVSNTATATGTAPSGGVFTDVSDNGDDSDGNSDDDPTVTVTPATPGFELTKTAVLNDGGDGADAGDSVDYTLVIANTGNVTLSAVGIATDTLSRIGGGGLTLTTGPAFVANSGASAEGELAPGETATFSASYTLAQADIDAGGVSNTATATGTAPSGGVFTDVSDNGDDSDGNSDDDPTVTVTPATPGFELTKTALLNDGGDGADAGDSVDYTLVIANTGNVTLSAVGIATDTLSRIGGGGLTLTSGPAFVANSGASAEGELAPGETATFSASYTLAQADIDAGGVSNTATATGTAPSGGVFTDVSDNGDDSDGNSDDDPTITVTPAMPGFELTKTAVLNDGGDGADAGDSVDYTLVIANTGNVTLSAVGIATDTLSRIGGGGLTLTSGPAFVANSGASAEGELAPGETATFSASYTLAQADIDAGGVSNTATATGTAPSGGVFTDISDNGDDSDGNSDDDPTVTVTPATPGFELTKTAVLNDGGDGADAGDSVDYTLVIANTGNVTLSAVGIATDTLSRIGGGGLTLTSGPAFVANSGASAEGELAPGETATFSASYTLAQADIDAGGVSNTATATGTAPSGGVFTDVSDNGDDSDGNSDDDPTVTTITAITGLRATLTAWSPTMANGANPSFVDPGDTIPFALTVANEGNVTMTSLNVIGMNGLATGACAPSTLAPGEMTTCAVMDHVITPADADAGGVEHSAMAMGSSPGNTDDVTDMSDTGAGSESTNDPDLSGTNADSDPTNDPTVMLLTIPALGAQLIDAAKTADRETVIYGESVTFTLSFENISGAALTSLSLHDRLPPGMVYTPGSAMLDGVATEPAIGETLSWGGVSMAPGATATVVLTARVLADTPNADLVNRAWVADGTGARVSDVGMATVRIEAEHVFDCADIIGRVFDDHDRSGHQSAGEAGFAGVRIGTVRGVWITTDEHGRYHVPCHVLPQENGSNVILKVDPQSLPSGYTLTTENPRVLRVTPGKMARINFGAALSGVVRIDLDAAAFVPGGGEIADGSAPTEALADAIRTIATDPASGHSVIRLRYHLGEEDRRVAYARLATVEALLRAAGAEHGHRPLKIEREISRAW